MMTLTRLCAIALAALLVAACGQKGPLVLPADAPARDTPRTADEPLADDEWVREDEAARSPAMPGGN